MVEFNMLIGISGSGKSSIANSLAKEKTIIISSDGIREQLFGNESIQGDPNQIFTLMRDGAIKALSDDLSVIYDATNLVRKHRIATLNYIKNKLKNKDIKYVCTIVSCPWEQCVERNFSRPRNVPLLVLENQLKSFSIPLYEGWDDIRIIQTGYGNNDELLVSYLTNLHELSQKGKYHVETADIHSLLANIFAMSGNYSERVKRIALYHDIGKPVTITFDRRDDGEEVTHFYGHEHAGAYFYLTTALDGLCNEDVHKVLRDAFLIQIHDILKTKNKIVNVIDEEMKEDLRQIDEIDERATIRPDEYYESVDIR